MIAYIKGELILVTKEEVLVERDGIGYAIQMPLSAIQALPPNGSQVKIHTYLYVREDAMKLYGFLSKEDLEVFRLLLTVSGIGPRGALGILSSITPKDLRLAVLSDDGKAISKAPGIGMKTAKKLILELKDKLRAEDEWEDPLARDAEGEADEPMGDIRGEAFQALTALGYSNGEAMAAVRKVELSEGMSVEELLKRSLKYL